MSSYCHLAVIAFPLSFLDKGGVLVNISVLNLDVHTFYLYLNLVWWHSYWRLFP